MAREAALFCARLYDDAERHQDSLGELKKIIKITPALTAQERGLLAVAHKNLTGKQCAARRILQDAEQRKQAAGNAGDAALAQTCRAVVERELEALNTDILALLDTRLIPAAGAGDAAVSFLALKARCMQQLAEVKGGAAIQAAARAFAAASDRARAELPPVHATRLSIALEFSLFTHDVLNEPDKACSMAQEAFDAAIVELDGAEGQDFSDATCVMQMLRDNLTQWTETCPS